MKKWKFCFLTGYSVYGKFGYTTVYPKLTFFDAEGPKELDLTEKLFNRQKEKERLFNELGIRFPNFAISKKEILEGELVSLVLYNLGIEGWESIDGHFFKKEIEDKL